MKKTFYSIVFIASLVFNSCSGDRCDVGHTEVTVNGQDICMPDYFAGEIQDFNKGNDFYHEKYGIISFKNQKWYTLDGEIINNKLLDN
jgi:hypothetical protein